MRIMSIVLSFCIMSGVFTGCGEQKGEMRDITTMELVQDMGLGINLGNTFESSGWTANSVTAYETGWGSPVITKEMIEGYKNAGFGVLRIPVAWSNLMTGNYDISPDYLNRVTEVIDYALDSGMYVIMNIHWDGGWFSRFANEEDRDECMYKYERIWTQLSEHFKNYSDYLMFESLNEEGGWDEIWNKYSNEGDKELSFGILNEMNQKFVDIVRNSGGNNAKRHLLIAGYNTDITLTCDELFKMPDDPENRCAVSVHYYTPSTFAILESDADWGKCRSEWGTDADFEELEKNMNLVKETFIDNGIPVIVGEYGCPKKNKDEESIRLFLSSVCKSAYSKGMCPVLWDITGTFYDRSSCKFYDEELLSDLMEAKELDRA